MKHLSVKSLYLSITVLSMSASAATLPERLQYRSSGSHQGGVFKFEQNTIKAFEDVRREGVKIVELDLRLSSDGVPVVFYEAKTDFWLKKCKGTIEERKFLEVKKCDFRFNKEKIPSFEEVLKWSSGRIVINGDLMTPEVAAPAARLIKKYGAYDWVYLHAQTDLGRIEAVRAIDPDVYMSYRIDSVESMNEVLALDDSRLLIIEFDEKMRIKKWIDHIHASGKLASVNAWDFDLLGEILNSMCGPAFKYGFDIAISNNADDCADQDLLF